MSLLKRRSSVHSRAIWMRLDVGTSDDRACLDVGTAVEGYVIGGDSFDGFFGSDVDAAFCHVLECVIRKVGIDDVEDTTSHVDQCHIVVTVANVWVAFGWRVYRVFFSGPGCSKLRRTLRRL